MSNAISFDTLAYAKKLKTAGFTEAQAEAQAEAIVSLVEERLATKQDILDLKRDIKEMESRTEVRMKAMESRTEVRIKELETKISESKAETIKWFVGLLFVQTGFILAILKLVP